MGDRDRRLETMLTNGYSWPSLCAGPLVLLVLHRTWRDAEVPRLPERIGERSLAAGAVVGLLATGAVFDYARTHVIYA